MFLKFVLTILNHTLREIDGCRKLEIKSPYTLLKLSYLEIREAEIKNFLHEYCQTFFLLIGRNKFAIGHFGNSLTNKKSGRFLSKTMRQIFSNRFEIFRDDKLCL